MSDLRAPEQLREAVLKEARARRGGASTAATGKGPSRPSVFFRHHRTRILVIAAALPCCSVRARPRSPSTRRAFGIVNDLMAEPLSPDENAAKEPVAKENSLELDTSQFKGGGGYSGPWYNPATTRSGATNGLDTSIISLCGASGTTSNPSPTKSKASAATSRSSITPSPPSSTTTASTCSITPSPLRSTTTIRSRSTTSVS